MEEANGNGHLVDRIIEKMMASLAQYQVVIDREQWIKEAEDAEHAGAKLTCAAIIRNTIHLGNYNIAPSPHHPVALITY